MHTFVLPARCLHANAWKCVFLPTTEMPRNAFDTGCPTAELLMRDARSVTRVGAPNAAHGADAGWPTLPTGHRAHSGSAAFCWVHTSAAAS